MKGGIDCIGGSYDLLEDCKAADCPSNVSNIIKVTYITETSQVGRYATKISNTPENHYHHRHWFEAERVLSKIFLLHVVVVVFVHFVLYLLGFWVFCFVKYVFVACTFLFDHRFGFNLTFGISTYVHDTLNRNTLTSCKFESNFCLTLDGNFSSRRMDSLAVVVHLQCPLRPRRLSRSKTLLHEPIAAVWRKGLLWQRCRKRSVRGPEAMPYSLCLGRNSIKLFCRT